MNDSRIQDIALQLVESSSMKVDEWKYTKIASLAGKLQGDFPLEKDELVICSFFCDPKNWYVFTTRRIDFVHNGLPSTIGPKTVTDTSFGNFKGYGANRQFSEKFLEEAKIVSDGKTYNLSFETGYASMAPINTIKFWQLKYPVIDKLMTSSEREAYKNMAGKT